MRGIKVSCILIIFILFISSTGTEKTWTKQLNKNGVQVFLRECDNCKIKEFKVQAKISAPISKVLALLLDFHNYPKWVFTNKGTFQLEKKNTDEYIYYTIIDCPKPTEDRDLIVDFKIAEQTDKKIYIKTSTLPKYIAEKPKIVRVQIFSGSWELVKISESETLVTTTCYSEPGGTVPSWLINTFILTGPYNTMLRMQQIFDPKFPKSKESSSK